MTKQLKKPPPVTVRGANGGPYTVTFDQKWFTGQTLPLLVADTSGLKAKITVLPAGPKVTDFHWAPTTSAPATVQGTVSVDSGTTSLHVDFRAVDATGAVIDAGQKVITAVSGTSWPFTYDPA